MEQSAAGYRILLADDHVLIRHGIKRIIDQDKKLTIIAEVGDGEELRAFLEAEAPDLLILDITMPKVSGFSHVAEIRAQHPAMKILILTMHKNVKYFYQAMANGADGYLLKDDSEEELLSAIGKIRSGKTYISPTLADDFTPALLKRGMEKKGEPYGGLTKREYEILELIVAGCTSRVMADKLCLSPRTVEHHRARLLKKFNMKNSADLASFAVHNGFIIPQ